MRERANKIEELKSQLRAYEEPRLPTPQEEDNPRDRKSSMPTMARNEKVGDGWCASQHAMPVMTPGNQRQAVPLANGNQLGGRQQQGGPFAMEQQPAKSPRPVSQQGMEWPVPNINESHFTEHLTPAPSLSLDGVGKTDAKFGPISSDPFASSCEGFSFDTPRPDRESQKLTSLLHMAVARNHVDTIRVLLQDRRVAVDEKDDEGFTPLEQAVMQGRSEAVKLLLEHSGRSGVGGSAQPAGTTGVFENNSWGYSI